VLAAFRAANETIAGTAAAVRFTGDKIPFLCECPDEGCSALIPLNRDEFDAARSRPHAFFARHGHEPDEADVVDSAEGFLLYESDGIDDSAGGENR
jgi:hypothetical protein